MALPVTIGVSACLLGEHVRYGGGHKHDRCLAGVLGTFFSFMPVCPEVGGGLPVPRETMQLGGDPAAPRLITCRTRIDVTGQMLACCATQVEGLERENLSGFVFKERSPGCGLSKVPLHGSGSSGLFSAGLFAHEVSRRFPCMPLEEAEQLNDPRIRENFIEQVFRYSCSKET